ncbi:MAG: metal-dependent hydrolase [bacterium]|jgi:L-ascorbate metabolism protein UlaG (beta-lactamase superfamily)|nr:MAG: metal-dependent hydrolase [bacterium]
MARLTWHGHACFTLVTDDGTRIMFDPWLDQNPAADIRTDQVQALDYILVSHGHFDHFADAIPLARKTGATLVAIYELAAFAQSKGVEKTHGMSIGGGYRFPFGYAKLTPALHGPNVAGDDEGTFTCMPGGWWLDLGGKRLYHAGDTALITDMQLLKGRVDVALLPIGDNYTMGPEDAARAVEFIEPRIVVPMHYNTFDLIRQDPAEFARLVGDRARVEILEPGGSLEF